MAYDNVVPKFCAAVHNDTVGMRKKNCFGECHPYVTAEKYCVKSRKNWNVMPGKEDKQARRTAILNPRVFRMTAHRNRV